MTDNAFQAQVIDSLARLETKMDALVGADGNGGWKQTTDQSITDLQRERWKRTGAIGFAAALFGGLCEFLGRHVFSAR